MRIFLDAYITAALFAETDGSDIPLDCRYGVGDISDETYRQMTEDCDHFLRRHYDDIADRLEQAAHDFWLTRNHHGAGFWDTGEWEATLGKKLTESAHSFGEMSLYIGDDGKIHH